MFTYRLCNKSDLECWTAMNRAFMAEEIQDDGLWNNTGQTSDEQFAKTFAKAAILLLFISPIFPLSHLETVDSLTLHASAISKSVNPSSFLLCFNI